MEHGTLQPEECNSTTIKTVHSPMQILENSLSEDITRATPHPLVSEKLNPLISPVTPSLSFIQTLLPIYKTGNCD